MKSMYNFHVNSDSNVQCFHILGMTLMVHGHGMTLLQLYTTIRPWHNEHGVI